MEHVLDHFVAQLDLAAACYLVYERHLTSINKKCHIHVTNAPKGIGQA